VGWTLATYKEIIADLDKLPVNPPPWAIPTSAQSRRLLARLGTQTPSASV
jgi:hypothetical protein